MFFNCQRSVKKIQKIYLSERNPKLKLTALSSKFGEIVVKRAFWKTAWKSATTTTTAETTTTLGHRILRMRDNGSTHATELDRTRRAVFLAKAVSMGSSLLGLVFIPTISIALWESAMESQAAMGMMLTADLFVGAFTFTPLLLHFLVKRFVADLYYNPKSKVFTAVLYNFFLQTRALRFQSDELTAASRVPTTNRLFLPFSTCLVRGRPLVLSLEQIAYTDSDAWAELTKNIVFELSSPSSPLQQQSAEKE